MRGKASTSFLRSALAAAATMVLASLEGQAASVKTNVLVPLEANLAILPEIVPVGNSLLFIGSVIGRKGIHLYRVEPGGAPIQIAELGKHGFCFDEERQAVQFTGNDQRRVVVSTKTWQPVDLEPRPFPNSQQECSVRTKEIGWIRTNPHIYELSGVFDLLIQFFETGPRDSDTRKIRVLESTAKNVKSEIAYDWRLRDVGSMPLSIDYFSHRRFYLPEGEGVAFYPFMVRYERQQIWQPRKVLRFPVISRRGTHGFLEAPWASIFLQDYFDLAQSHSGLIAAIESAPDESSNSDAGVWLLRDGRYSQIYHGQVKSRSLTVSRDGCRAYFLGVPGRDTLLTEPKTVVSLDFCG